MKLFIGCSSSNDIPEIYNTNCTNYLEELFKLDNELVFGAYNKGLMALSYNIAKKHKRKVTGITPKIFIDALKDLECNHEMVTTNINSRTDKLIEESDALIFLPGGIGTIYELFTAIECIRNHEINNSSPKFCIPLDYIGSQNDDDTVFGNDPE